MSKVRWGLLSTARINDMVIPAIKASPRGELAAVASRSAAKANAYAAERDIAHVFASYEAMLASDTVDAVYIALPNHLHAEWSIKAMQQGKHVLCEKPLADTAAQARELADIAREKGLDENSTVEGRMAALEGAPAAFATATGMAAVFTALGALLGEGDRVVVDCPVPDPVDVVMLR